MYGPSTCTELNVIGGAFGGAGLFCAASFSALGDMAFGAGSIDWTGIAGFVAGSGWAASATVKFNVAAQLNSKRYLTMRGELKAERSI